MAEKGKYQVLVVDDELSIHRIIQRLGQRLDFHMTGAQSLNDVRKLDSELLSSFSLAIVDIVLLDGSGLDVYTALRAWRADLPVLFVSSFSRGSMEVSAVVTTDPLAEFMAKPFNLLDLMEHISQCLKADDSALGM